MIDSGMAVLRYRSCGCGLVGLVAGSAGFIYVQGDTCKEPEADVEEYWCRVGVMWKAMSSSFDI